MRCPLGTLLLLSRILSFRPAPAPCCRGPQDLNSISQHFQARLSGLSAWRGLQPEGSDAAGSPEVSFSLRCSFIVRPRGARRRGWLGRRRLICMEPQRDSQEKSELIIRAGCGHRALNCIRRLLVFIECIRCKGRSRKLWAGDLPACHHGRCLWLDAGSQGSFQAWNLLEPPPPLLSLNSHQLL